MSSLQYRKNLYTCERCGATFVTIDRDKGTTPFITSCQIEGCGGAAQSHFYRVDQSLVPTHEWHRLTDDEAKSLSPAWRQHHDFGGLALRRIEP